MSFFEDLDTDALEIDLGLGAANPGTLTSILDPGDLAGTRSGAEAKDAAEKAAQEQETAAQTAARLQKE